MKTKVLTLEVKKRAFTRTHEKRHVSRWQIQTMGNLAAGVNKMAELQAKRLKLQEGKQERTKKERENFLQFRQNEAERNRQHELQLAARLSHMPQSFFAKQRTSHKFQFQGMSSQKQMAFPVTPTAVTAPVQSSNT